MFIGSYVPVVRKMFGVRSWFLNPSRLTVFQIDDNYCDLTIDVRGSFSYRSIILKSELKQLLDVFELVEE